MSLSKLILDLGGLGLAIAAVFMFLAEEFFFGMLFVVVAIILVYVSLVL